MQKQLTLVLGVLLGSYLPASAQTHSTQLSLMQERPPPKMTLLAAASSHLPLSASLPTRPLAEHPAHFTTLLAAVLNRGGSLDRRSPIEVYRTPFVRQTRVTVVQLWSGRLQLGGFASRRQMENVLLGLLGPNLLGHPGARVPRANKSYGLSLTFRLGRDAHTGRRMETCRCLSWIVGAGCDGRP